MIIIIITIIHISQGSVLCTT